MVQPQVESPFKAESFEGSHGHSAAPRDLWVSITEPVASFVMASGTVSSRHENALKTPPVWGVGVC